MGLYANGKKINVNNFVVTQQQVDEGIAKKIQDGTLKATQTVLSSDDYEFQEVVKQYPQCKNYKGIFSYPSDANYWTTTAQKGDYWIQGFTNIIHYHRYVFEPGDIMYFNGTNLEPLKVIKKDKAIKPVQEIYDICIVGGGAGGIGCAYALKDLGLKVILIDRESQLGGTHVSAGLLSMIASPVNGDWFKTILNEEREKGYVQFRGKPSEGSENNAKTVGEGTEFEQKYRASLYNTSSSNIGNLTAISPYQIAKRYYNDLNGKIDIRLNTEFIENIYGNDSKKVIGIKVRDRLNNTIYNINAYYFVDCSADGVLCRSGKTKGKDYFIGSDAKTKYNESAYTDGFEGNETDINTIDLLYNVPGNSYKTGEVTRTEDFTKIKPFSDITSGSVNGYYYEPTVKNLRIISPGKNLKVPVSIIVEKGYETALLEAKQRVKYHYSKISWNSVNGSGGYAGSYPMLAIRETYRINCDRMLQQSDVETRATSSNYVDNHTVALSSWYVDIHNSTNIGTINSSMLIGVPFECLIPTAFTNVLVGSRCFGASHIGASAVRLTRTMMSLGYVCGKAMELAVKDWLDDVRNIDITTLQTNVGIADLITEMETYFPQS